LTRTIGSMLRIGGVCALLALPACSAYGSSTNGSGAYQAAAAGSQAPGYGDNSGYGDAGSTPTGAAAPAPAAPKVAHNWLTRTVIPKMGAVVTDSKGWVLYRFDKDSATPPMSNCYGTCAEIWHPALTDGHPVLRGIDAGLVGTVRRADGSLQLTLHGWPLYHYIGDPKPGAWKGQGVGGTWWVAAPNGSKNLTCVPKVTPKSVPPPTDTSDGGGYTY
jgi:predicted lipoprotein with Yx(FWY)xxD motif